MTIFVSRHLTQTEYSVLTTEAVIVSLLTGMYTRVWLAAGLRRRVLLESGRVNRIQFVVLSTMGHHFVGVRADELTLQTVKMRRFVLAFSCVHTVKLISKFLRRN